MVVSASISWGNFASRMEKQFQKFLCFENHFNLVFRVHNFVYVFPREHGDDTDSNVEGDFETVNLEIQKNQKFLYNKLYIYEVYGSGKY